MAPFPEFALTLRPALAVAMIAAAFRSRMRISLSVRTGEAVLLASALAYLLVFGAR